MSDGALFGLIAGAIVGVALGVATGGLSLPATIAVLTPLTVVTDITITAGAMAIDHQSISDMSGESWAALVTGSVLAVVGGEIAGRGFSALKGMSNRPFGGLMMEAGTASSAQRIAVGKNLYLFRNTDSNATRLVIRAHGAYLPRDKFELQTTALHFYSRHGDNLLSYTGDNASYGSSRLLTVLKGDKRVIETYSSGDVIEDYTLSKAQGNHQLFMTEHRIVGPQGLGAGQHEDQPYFETYASIMRDLNEAREHPRYANENRDVLTIRNRFNKKSIRLSEVLRQLQAHGYNYSSIDGYFCRGRYEGT
ncbi:putative adhesin [Herbaspirillum sp. CF444]|uniref:putative adhesin n=1 Tax=Herbaspirillum sp. CF444 TaxID=1144319 RepID=UPI003FCEC74F